VSRPKRPGPWPGAAAGFNPVLGFLSVSTHGGSLHSTGLRTFQSRAGFSECLDEVRRCWCLAVLVFQSRAGFSECLDACDDRRRTLDALFQSRAGFSECLDLWRWDAGSSDWKFQSRAGFSECLDRRRPNTGVDICFNPVLGFLSVSTSH